MKSAVKHAALFGLALLGAYVIFGGLGAGGTLALLTFTCGLAIAGTRNWLAWSLVFIVLTGVFIGLFSLTTLLARSSNDLYVGLLMFGLLPIFPAFMLWCSHMLGKKRGTFRPRAQAELND